MNPIQRYIPLLCAIVLLLSTGLCEVPQLGQADNTPKKTTLKELTETLNKENTNIAEYKCIKDSVENAIEKPSGNTNTLPNDEKILITNDNDRKKFEYVCKEGYVNSKLENKSFLAVCKKEEKNKPITDTECITSLAKKIKLIVKNTSIKADYECNDNYVRNAVISNNKELSTAEKDLIGSTAKTNIEFSCQPGYVNKKDEGKAFLAVCEKDDYSTVYTDTMCVTDLTNQINKLAKKTATQLNDWVCASVDNAVKTTLNSGISDTLSESEKSKYSQLQKKKEFVFTCQDDYENKKNEGKHFLAVCKNDLQGNKETLFNDTECVIKLEKLIQKVDKDSLDDYECDPSTVKNADITTGADDMSVKLSATEQKYYKNLNSDKKFVFTCKAGYKNKKNEGKSFLAVCEIDKKNNPIYDTECVIKLEELMKTVSVKMTNKELMKNKCAGNSVKNAKLYHGVKAEELSNDDKNYYNSIDKNLVSKKNFAYKCEDGHVNKKNAANAFLAVCEEGDLYTPITESECVSKSSGKKSSGKKPMATWAIASIAVGSVVLVGGIGAAVYFLKFR